MKRRKNFPQVNAVVIGIPSEGVPLPKGEFDISALGYMPTHLSIQISSQFYDGVPDKMGTLKYLFPDRENPDLVFQAVGEVKEMGGSVSLLLGSNIDHLVVERDFGVELLDGFDGLIKGECLHRRVGPEIVLPGGDEFWQGSVSPLAIYGNGQLLVANNESILSPGDYDVLKGFSEALLSSSRAQRAYETLTINHF